MIVKMGFGRCILSKRQSQGFCPREATLYSTKKELELSVEFWGNCPDEPLIWYWLQKGLYGELY